MLNKNELEAIVAKVNDDPKLINNNPQEEERKKTYLKIFQDLFKAYNINSYELNLDHSTNIINPNNLTNIIHDTDARTLLNHCYSYLIGSMKEETHKQNIIKCLQTKKNERMSDIITEHLKEINPILQEENNIKLIEKSIIDIIPIENITSKNGSSIEKSVNNKEDSDEKELPSLII